MNVYRLNMELVIRESPYETTAVRHFVRAFSADDAITIASVQGPFTQRRQLTSVSCMEAR